MTPSNRRLIPERIQNAYMRLIAPLIRLFTRWGMNPNTFTVAGVIITSFAAVAFFLQSPRLGGSLVLPAIRVRPPVSGRCWIPRWIGTPSSPCSSASAAIFC
jgi:hypothetical protein